MANSKVKAASLSVASNTGLTILKIFVGILTGSVSIMSEALHSAIDLIASFIALFSVQMSKKPADREHPYGHGKIENVSGVVEGLLIFVAAGFIVKEAVEKLIHPQIAKDLEWGIALMVLSSILNIIVSGILYKTAKREKSIALEADALHLRTDIITSAGVALGLTLIHFTGWYWFDPFIALIVALLIVKEASNLIYRAFSPLLDAGATQDEELLLKEVLYSYAVHHVGFHDLRARRSGNKLFVDLHLTMPKSWTLEKAHGLTEEVEKKLQEKLGEVEATIHMEPN